MFFHSDPLLTSWATTWQNHKDDLVSPFRVQVLLELFRAHLAVYPVRWDLRFGGPHNGIQHQLAEIVVAPVLVKMRPGETKTAATVIPFADPGDSLRFAAFHRRPDRGVALMWAIPPAHRTFRGDRAQ